MQIKPLGDRVLIKPLSQGDRGITLPSGIIIPETVDQEKTDRGTVIAVGEGKRNNSGELIQINVTKGDIVLFQWGDKVEIDGEEYYIVGESGVLAIIS
ncbi:co-chaperone GroES [Patescibacteria group bacterium]|nr:co-chaperone GroES [Patescibacteria group bacterium]